MSSSANPIKGTTRVSNNDRKLMTDLWKAGKDNPLEKNRLKRKLTQTEKSTRQAMPEERAEAAFKNLWKKQKTFVPHIEPQENDDLLALHCVETPSWSDFCLRQSALCIDNDSIGEFATILKQRKKKKDAPPFDRCSAVFTRWLEPAINAVFSKTTRGTEHAARALQQQQQQQQQQTFRFLGDVKNKRFQNFRVKSDAHRARYSTLLTDQTLNRLSTHFFNPHFCRRGMSAVAPHEYRFVPHQDVHGNCQLVLASGSDFGDDVVRRLATCRATGRQMHLRLSAESPQRRATLTQPPSAAVQCRKSAAVELVFANGYDGVRQPRILLRCDYCCQTASTESVIPHTCRLFFHDTCATPSASPTTVVATPSASPTTVVASSSALPTTVVATPSASATTVLDTRNSYAFAIFAK